MKHFDWIVEKLDGEDTLNKFLRKKIPLEFQGREISNSKIRRLIVSGAVCVNGIQRRVPSFVLRVGSKVGVDFDEEKFFYEKKPDDIEYTLTAKDVLFEDDSIIVVNKPAFIPTEGTIVQDRFSMHQAVVDYLWKKNPNLRNPPYVGIMHRLDRETSGVLLFTKTRAVNGAVHHMFENRLTVKKYRAVCGIQKNVRLENHFSVENYIGRVSSKSSMCKIGLLDEKKGGQYAKTDFDVVAVKNGFAYVDCRLHTGRTHQIRVHLSLSYIPIVGDELYGGRRGFDSNNGRIMLHAFSLEFPHPVTNERIVVEAPMEKEFIAP